MTFARARAYVILGQSYGQEGYDRTPAYSAFQEAIRRVINTDAADIQTNIGGSPTLVAGNVFQRRNQAFDGSAVLEKNKGSITTNYWLENDGTTAGPRLTTAVNAITALSQKPILAVYSHGEQDAGFTTTSALAEEVTDGMVEIFDQIRTAAGDANMPFFVDILGQRFVSQEFNEYRLRDAMLAMIAAEADVFRGCEKYPLLLDNTTHPTTDIGYATMGAWTGRKVAAWLLDETLPGPSIASAVRTGNNVAVTITVPSGGTLIKPAQPDYFGLFDASDNRIPITDYSWSGDVLTITGASVPARLRYPARENKLADIARVVRLSNPSNANRLFVGEPGLPLESAPTFTL